MSTNTPYRLLVVIASTRPGRVGPRIASWFASYAATAFDVTVADLAEIDLPMLDEPEHAATGIYAHEHTRRWSVIVADADAIVFVMPEYNGGFTAPLKNALDFLYDEWRDKPVGFVGYGMSSGGMRAVHMIKPVLLALGMVPVSSAVTVRLREVVDGDGHLVPHAAMAEAAAELVADLARLAPALAGLRTQPAAG
ncbi:NADPH-dependent FMN reductase [Fodinicola acaciae]|uniref:NADPH-dependent FMN reductase n=1 Tax=Fodinicola acaciae TaxID=2681555 RepID=UPI0013D7E50B|nr:NAD(P)H-dependent oxidoreductase [Fodinicola acaciae]